ncbi:KOW motif-containing protein [Aulosira sp. FACHB-615]|uniref:KOW motif-containing protein n=1 Tax=Aulosira sp. FACHB-615 TaxID=2692777 RepID=UPI001F549BCD|nr:KOW motif-containing protein [Aulosira sp. FACHB-615]
MLRYVKIEGVIGEPCVGAGAIASLLQAWPHTKQLWTNDVDPNKQADYHHDATLRESWEYFTETDWIITNPPYADQAAPIIKNAFEKARVGVVAFLLTSFLEPCGDRADFLKEHPPSLVLTFPRYCFRKDKSGKRWATDNTTISCFVWDKRATTQQLIVRPQSEIIGFYKNPDHAISQQEVEEIMKSIAASNPDTTAMQSLTRRNINPGVCISDYYGEIGTIKDDFGFGFTVQWHKDGDEITYNWERDSEGIKHLSIVSQSVAIALNDIPKTNPMEFQFPEADAIAQQIAQLQEQLEIYNQCKVNANRVKEQVVIQAQLMLELGVSQQSITDWANRIYFLVTGTNVGEMATKSVELAAKLMLAEQDNQSLKDERDRLLSRIKELENPQPTEQFKKGDRVSTDMGEEGEVTGFAYGNTIVKMTNGEFQFRADQLTKVDTRFEVGDRVRITKGQHKDKFAVIKEVGNQISCWVDEEFFFHFSPSQLIKIEEKPTNPQTEAQKRGQEFIAGVKKPADVTWGQISDVCQRDRAVLKEISLNARNKAQKALVEQLPQKLADWIEETGDRTDLEWVGDTLKAKVEELLSPKEEVV